MTKEFATQYLTELMHVAGMFSLEDFDRVVNAIAAAHAGENSIFLMGNGGSGATASHFTCDLNKGVCRCVDNKRMRAICLNDNVPSLLAYANDVSYDDVFIEQLKNFLRPDDVVIGLSGSGNSQNVVRALEYANGSGATSVAFTGFDGGALARLAHVSVVVPLNDMQKVEDMHLILTHMIMRILCKRLAPEAPEAARGPRPYGQGEPPADRVQ